MYDLLKEFIKPEFLVLVPVLYMLGMAAKRSKVYPVGIRWYGCGIVSGVPAGDGTDQPLSGWVYAGVLSIDAGYFDCGCECVCEPVD